jgi:CheY-like chemotaxis protein
MSSKTILSVENDKDVREMIVAIVESLGHTCLEAASAREAIDVLKKNVVDLILLDIHMPGARGNQFLKFIRARGTQVPVIVVSGYLQTEVVKEVTDLDVAAVLSKPIRVKRLAEELQKIFGSDS